MLIDQLCMRKSTEISQNLKKVTGIILFMNHATLADLLQFLVLENPRWPGNQAQHFGLSGYQSGEAIASVR